MALCAVFASSFGRAVWSDGKALKRTKWGCGLECPHFFATSIYIYMKMSYIKKNRAKKHPQYPQDYKFFLTLCRPFISVDPCALRHKEAVDPCHSQDAHATLDACDRMAASLLQSKFPINGKFVHEQKPWAYGVSEYSWKRIYGDHLNVPTY